MWYDRTRSDTQHSCLLLTCADARQKAGATAKKSREIVPHVFEQEANPAAVDGVLELGIL
jgi:hypothetical protein